MAYAQWATFKIDVKSPDTDIVIDDVNIKWGKFHEYNNKENKISSEDIKNKIINSSTSESERIISTCGLEHSASGTEGEFCIYYKNNNHKDKIGKIYWDCPWGSKTNQCVWEKHSEHFMVEVTGFNTDSGALGNVRILIMKVD